MKRCLLAISIVAPVCGNAVASADFTRFVKYKGHALVAPSGSTGIPGVTILTSEWRVPNLPAPGTCATYAATASGPTELLSLSDGVHSLTSLAGAGYTVLLTELPKLYLCTNAKSGNVMSGHFTLRMYTNQGVAPDQLYQASGSVNDDATYSAQVSSCRVTKKACVKSGYEYDNSAVAVKSFQVRLIPIAP